MRHSRPDGNSLFGSPIYILDTVDSWTIAIKSIQQKWRFISLTAEVLSNTDPVEISILNAYCLNGPVYIFDFQSVGHQSAKKLIKGIIENKEIFKVVFDLEEIGTCLWKNCQCKLLYTIDTLIAYNISANLAMSHKIHISNFCSWIGKVNIPFIQEISQEIANPDYWKRRPLIYIMQCYLSGTVSVIMKSWLDIRVGLNDEQVHSVFNVSKDIMGKICGESINIMPKSPDRPFVFSSCLNKFSFDKLCIDTAFDKVVNDTAFFSSRSNSINLG